MITAVGITHKTAPLSVRERFALGAEAVDRLLAELPDEALALVTCNRTELYGTSSADMLRAALQRAAGPAAASAPLLVLAGPEAVRHLLAVAAGLDSLVVGEPQILGQVREALRTARRAGKLGPVLDRLGRRALQTGRRVRIETPLGRDRPSIPKVAVRAAAEVMGDLRGRKLLVVGAGKVGRLVVHALATEGAGEVVVINRTPAAAEALAADVGGRAAPFSQLASLLVEVDIVISCTGSPEPVLGAALLRRSCTARGGRPLLVMDIAVPRDVDPAAREIPELHLFDMDDLRARASTAVPAEVLARASAIVEEEASAFLRWLAERQAVPTIQALRQRAEAILEAEVARAGGSDSEEMRAFGRRVLNKFLHHPLVRIRERAASHGPAYLEMARDLFGLDTRDGDGS